MKQMLHSAEAAKQIHGDMAIKLIAFNIHNAAMDKADQAVRDNQRKATEIGPVLEEILQEDHWRHWGLND